MINLNSILKSRDIILPTKVCIVSESHSVMSNSLRPHGLYSPWNSLGQNTGESILSLLQGIFPTQGLNQGLRHCRQIFDRLSYSWQSIISTIFYLSKQ